MGILIVKSTIVGYNKEKEVTASELVFFQQKGYRVSFYVKRRMVYEI
jgi:hypothetical protein